MATALALILSEAPARLLSLSFIDVLIIVLYFVMILGIGFYLKSYTKTSEDFFMAGRSMTAWVAGLSFLAANLGSLELMGWAAAAYQYGILATHWYWIGAIPAMLFLGIVMMPFYYISKTHSVPGYLKLRYGEPARVLSAVTFGVMTVMMSGINIYSMALVMKAILGWNINYSIWISSLTVAAYVVLGGLRSAIFNEVLQFVLDLARRDAHPDYRTGGNRRLDRHGCAHQAKFPWQSLHASMEHARQLQRQSHGHPLDRHCSRPRVRHLVRLLDHRFPRRTKGPYRARSSFRENGADHWCVIQNDRAIHRDSSRDCSVSRFSLAINDWSVNRKPSLQACTATTKSYH